MCFRRIFYMELIWKHKSNIRLSIISLLDHTLAKVWPQHDQMNYFHECGSYLKNDYNPSHSISLQSDKRFSCYCLKHNQAGQKALLLLVMAQGRTHHGDIGIQSRIRTAGNRSQQEGLILKQNLESFVNVWRHGRREGEKRSRVKREENRRSLTVGFLSCRQMMLRKTAVVSQLRVFILHIPTGRMAWYEKYLEAQHVKVVL